MNHPIIQKAMVMSAGLGTRLAPFTEVCNKTFLPVMGIPIIQSVMESLLYAGVQTFVVNVHHHSVHVKKTLLEFKNNFKLLQKRNHEFLEFQSVQIHTSDETKKLLGSAGGLRNALPLLDSGPFFVVNADVLSNLDWHALSACHTRLRERWGVQLTLAIFPKSPNQMKYREIFFDAESQLITGLGDLTHDRPYFIGAAVLESEILKSLSLGEVAHFVPALLEPAIHQKKAGAFLTDGKWYDIGTPQAWLQTHLAWICEFEKQETGVPLGSFLGEQMNRYNQKIGDHIWIPRGVTPPSEAQQWKGPCYWHPVLQKQSLMVPSELGPHAVVYGGMDTSRVLKSGIGFADRWVSVDPLPSLITGITGCSGSLRL